MEIDLRREAATETTPDRRYTWRRSTVLLLRPGPMVMIDESTTARSAATSESRWAKSSKDVKENLDQRKGTTALNSRAAGKLCAPSIVEQERPKKPCIALCVARGCLAYGCVIILQAFKNEIANRSWRTASISGPPAAPALRAGALLTVYPRAFSTSASRSRMCRRSSRRPSLKGDHSAAPLPGPQYETAMREGSRPFPSITSSNRLLLDPKQDPIPHRIEDYIASAATPPWPRSSSR